jgi:hypothetical protein
MKLTLTGRCGSSSMCRAFRVETKVRAFRASKNSVRTRLWNVRPSAISCPSIPSVILCSLLPRKCLTRMLGTCNPIHQRAIADSIVGISTGESQCFVRSAYQNTYISITMEPSLQGSRSIYVVHNTAECKYMVSSNIDESTWQTQWWGSTKRLPPGMTAWPTS